MDNQPRNNALNESALPPQQFSELLAQWGELYAANYGKEPTVETFLTYKIGLSDLEPRFLHSAFAECLRTSIFPPNVAKIRAAYDVIYERETRTYFEGPEPIEELSKSDKQVLAQLFNEFWDEHLKMPSEAMPGMRWTPNQGWLARQKSLELEEIERQVPAKFRSVDSGN